MAKPWHGEWEMFLSFFLESTRQEQKKKYIMFFIMSWATLTSDVEIAVVVQLFISIRWNKSSKVGSDSGSSCFYDRF